MHLPKCTIVEINFTSCGKKINASGSMKFLVDELDIIIDWRINFKTCCFSPESTHSWSKETSNSLNKRKFDTRQAICNTLGIQHFSPNLKRIRHTYIPLNKEQLISLSNYFNSSCYKNNFGGMKMIDTLISGSNASGSGANNSSEAIRTVNKNGEYENFLNFITEIWSKDWRGVDALSKIDSIWESATSVRQFHEWLERKKDLALYYYQMNVDQKSYGLNETKKTTGNWAKPRMKRANEINKKTEMARDLFVKNIKEIEKINYSKIFNMFNMKVENIDYEKAHIKPIWLIKKEANKDYNNLQKHINEISDVNNFLPLSCNMHAKYDKKHFYYDQNGNMIMLKNEDTKNVINNQEFKHFSKISEGRLVEVKKYLKDWEEYLNNKQNFDN